MKCEYHDGCVVDTTDCDLCKQSFYCKIKCQWLFFHCDNKFCSERPNVAIQKK